MTVRRSVKASFAFIFAGVLAILAAEAIVPTARAQNAPQDAPQAALTEDVTAAFARMGKTLAAKQFSFRSHQIRAYVGPNGELLHIVTDTKTVVRRPDRIAVEITGDNGSTQLLYDGKTLVIFSVDHKRYLSIPLTGDIPNMVDVAEKRMGADLPLSDLLSSDSAHSVLSDVTSGGQVGTAIIDGVPCRHFFFNQSDDIELEIWLEDNDRSLPRRFYVTYRNLAGRPSFIAELSDWEFPTQISDSAFVFQPPAGAEKVDASAGGSAAPAPVK